MKEILHKILKGDYDISAAEEYSYIIRLICIVHISLFTVFIVLHVVPLAIFNAFSVILYLCLIFIIKKGHLVSAFNLTYLEIILHTALCTVLIGNTFGFQLYVLALIPVSFYIVFSLYQTKNLRFPIIYAIVSFFFFCGSNVYNHFRGSVYSDFPPYVQLILSLYNSLIAFAMMVLFSLLFILKIRKSMKKIEHQNLKLNYYASVDPLTKFLNRRKFTTDLKKLITSGEHFCILLSDIDDFKKINDSYGHDCGDQMLIHISTLYKKNISKPHMICRWGGEEIMVLYHGTLEDGVAIGELLRTTIANSSIQYNESTITATITTGISYFDGTTTIDDVIIHADNLLYEGKTSGKNVVKSASSTTHPC